MLQLEKIGDESYQEKIGPLLVNPEEISEIWWDKRDKFSRIAMKNGNIHILPYPIVELLDYIERYKDANKKLS